MTVVCRRLINPDRWLLATREKGGRGRGGREGGRDGREVLYVEAVKQTAPNFGLPSIYSVFDYAAFTTLNQRVSQLVIRKEYWHHHRLNELFVPGHFFFLNWEWGHFLGIRFSSSSGGGGGGGDDGDDGVAGAGDAVTAAKMKMNECGQPLPLSVS